MFLSKDYILSNELVKKMNIHIANISMLKQRIENSDNYNDILKMNNCTFINTKSLYLPKNIREGISANKFTDMSNKLPCTFVRTEYGITEKELMASGIIKEKVEVCDKDFYVFTDEFIEKTKGTVINILEEEDALDSYNDGSIDGYIKLSKNKYITWYKVW